MAKNSITDYSTIAGSNTDIGGIGVQGTNAVSNFDGAFRELMSQLADMNAGTSPIHDTMRWCDPTDTTKIFRFDGVGVTTGTTRVISIPDVSATMAVTGLAQTFTKTQTFPSVVISGATPTLTLTDTDTGADSVISANTASGSLTISADSGNEVASSIISFSVDGTQRATFDSTGAFNALGAVNVGGALNLSSSAPSITFTDTDTGGDCSLSANTSSGSLTISADNNAEVANSIISFSVDGTQRATIDSTGAINSLYAINITSASPILTFTDTDTNADSTISASSGSGSIVINADLNNEVASSVVGFAVDGTLRGSFDSNGDFNVGTFSATGATVGMTYDASEGIFRTSQNAATTKFHLAFYNTNGNIGSITTNTTTTTFATSSDYRRKEVSGPVGGFWDRVNALRPVEYVWRETGTADMGFLAHEFGEVYPGAVVGEKDAVDDEGLPIYQSLQASATPVVADIIAALQDINSRLLKLGV